MSIGTIAVKNPGIFSDWLKEFGPEKIFLGADVEGSRLAVRGWQEKTDVEIVPFLQEKAEQGISEVFATDISKDGAMVGPGFDLYKELVSEFPTIAVFASGGVRHKEDLAELADLGLAGVIVGKAFYEGTLSFEEALRC